MQHQTQYYRTVPVSEKPKESGKYMALEVNHGPAEWRELRYDKFNDSWFDGADCFHPTHYLEPIQIPDAELLRVALGKIVNHPGGPEQAFPKLTVDMFKHIAREALSQTGDGWIEIKQGCEMPEDNLDEVWANHISEGVKKKAGRYVREWREFYTHWKPFIFPLPPQPINK